jgi:PTS system beta-glucosides-specific IIC component
VNIQEEVSQILDGVGGKDNIKTLTHCVTRLRFTVKEEKNIDTKLIESLPDVLGIQNSGGQFQVIVGPKVDKLYKEAVSQTNGVFSNEELPEEKKKWKFSSILETLSAILIPSLPPVIGGGMIKGFLFMFWQFGWLEMDSPVFELINIISDGMFYFYPFLLAVSAAKRFKTNEYMALALAGSLMYPSIIQGAGESSEPLRILGAIQIPYIDYSSSVIPIILSVFAMSFVYRFFKDRIPDLLSTILTPMLTLAIMIPIELVLLAPLGFYLGDYVAKGMQVLLDFSPIVSGFVIGATRPFLVLTGTHHAMRAIVQQQISTYGYTTIGAMNYMSVIAQASAALGVFLVVKNKKMKNISFSSAVSGFLGVTEPALYGVIVKYKVVMIATMLGGGIAAAITSFFGSAEYAMVMSSLLTIPATFGDGFIGIVIGIPVAILVTLAVIFVGKSSILNQDEKRETVDVAESAEELSGKHAVEIENPTNGTVLPLSVLKDKTFANEVMGKGIAIASSDGILRAPIDGRIAAVFPTNHAISIISDTGVEVLLHVGIDTVNLKGQFLYPQVRQGDTVKIGDVLMEFNQERIKQAGYDDVVIMVVTNTQEYLEVLPNKEDGIIDGQEKLLTVLS